MAWGAAGMRLAGRPSSGLVLLMALVTGMRTAGPGPSRLLRSGQHCHLPPRSMKNGLQSEASNAFQAIPNPQVQS